MKVTIKLKEVRENKGLNLLQLSQKVGMPYSSLWRIEAGEQMPRIDTLCALAVALGVEPQNLYEYKK